MNISIVLVRPQLPDNIGSVARIMANFGIQDLRVVNPQSSDWNGERAEVLACKIGKSVLYNAKTYSNIENAVEDIEFIYASTARIERAMDKPFVYADAEDFSKMTSRKLGFLFGCESSGLENRELLVAQRLITFNTASSCSSLNLSQAVCIICYEISKNRVKQMSKEHTHKNRRIADKPASPQSLMSITNYVDQQLCKRNFFKNRNRKNYSYSFTSMLQRLQITGRELRILYGTFKGLSEKPRQDND